MDRLIAHYRIELEGGLQVKLHDEDRPDFLAPVGDFEVTIVLAERGNASSRLKTERLHTSECTALELSVYRAEPEALPAIAQTEQGGRDMSARAAYFGSREPLYRQAAEEALRRLSLFFQYRLHQPQADELARQHMALMNPQWRDETGREIDPGMHTFAARWMTGKGFGIIPFARKHGQKLSHALRKSLVPSLQEELLEDARSAAMRGNIRRAVLELAIACEVAVKRKFFGRSTGGQTLAFLEDQKGFQLPVVQLLDSGAREVFGQSFKDHSPKALEDIEHLFRCRNKVAHRGRPVFRPVRGGNVAVQTATMATVEEWLASARALLVWLKKLRRR
jgi:hypothetical protein